MHEFTHRPPRLLHALFGALSCLAACSAAAPASDDVPHSPNKCIAGYPCFCADGQRSTMLCNAGPQSAGECSCTANVIQSPPPATPPQTSPPGVPTAPTTPPAGNSLPPTLPQQPVIPNVPTGAAGAVAPAMPPTLPPGAGAMPPTMMTSSAGAPAMTSAAGAGAGMDLEMVRQVCVDTINMYRATKMLAPLTRMTSQETCSDMGAKKDGDSMQGHSSAFNCTGSYAQNSCPGYPVGGFGGATLADTLKTCLMQMWNEGEPPVSRQQCMQDTTGCFEMHGHYLNMTSNFKSVSCGFYKMTNGNWWMNQDFF
jgi:hypothetical protein